MQYCVHVCVLFACANLCKWLSVCTCVHMYIQGFLVDFVGKLFIFFRLPTFFAQTVANLLVGRLPAKRRIAICFAINELMGSRIDLSI